MTRGHTSISQTGNKRRFCKPETRLSCHMYPHLYSALLTTLLTTMSDTYADIAACAKTIVDLLGQSQNAQSRPPLTLSSRTPLLPETAFKELIPTSLHERLIPVQLEQLVALLDSQVRDTRHRFERQYWQVAGALYSTECSNLSDADVETWLLRTFENRYSRYLADVRKMLEKLSARLDRSNENRNARGGFGDVSSPPQAPANRSSITS